MSRDKTFIQKMKELGGTKDNPSCQPSRIDQGWFTNIEMKIKANLPKSFKEFHAMFGAFSFKEMVKVQCINPPIIAEDDLVTADYFYSVVDESECSILKILQRYSEQIPVGFFPICDGEPGDIICIKLLDEGYGEVHYWWHESLDELTTYKIASSFDDFIQRLMVVNEPQGMSSNNPGKTNVSPELLEKLRRSGYGPK